MTVVTALEQDPPVALVIGVEFNYALLHRGGLTGFHQRKIVSAMSQQSAEAMTRGVSCLRSRASAASTTPDNIQSCARLIIIRMTILACHTALRPRCCG